METLFFPVDSYRSFRYFNCIPVLIHKRQKENQKDIH